MKRYSLISLSAISAGVGLSLLSHNAPGQQKSLKEQLVGTWTLASVADVYSDGRRENSWGPAVKGAVSFECLTPVGLSPGAVGALFFLYVEPGVRPGSKCSPH
jgi:hypothetical protein